MGQQININSPVCGEGDVSMAMPTLSIICPMYNEEAALPAFFQRLVPVLETTGMGYEIVCVNDGSRDATLARLLEMRQQYPAITILNLSRNFGKEAALTCGIDHAGGAAVIPIDVDLQDPPELIPEMIALWLCWPSAGRPPGPARR